MKLHTYRSTDVKIILYSWLLIYYGVKIVGKDRRYSLELALPAFDGTKLPFKLYCKERKPFLKNLVLLNLIAIPAFVMYTIAFCLFAIVFTIIDFPHTILIEKSFLTTKLELIGGWIWIALAVFGAIQLINLF